jgi:hypothetical protein
MTLSIIPLFSASSTTLIASSMKSAIGFVAITITFLYTFPYRGFKKKLGEYVRIYSKRKREIEELFYWDLPMY